MTLPDFSEVEAADLPGSPWGTDFLEGIWSKALWFFEVNSMWLAIVIAVFTAAGVVALIFRIFGQSDDDDDD